MFHCKGTQSWSYFGNLSFRTEFRSNRFFQICGEDTQVKDLESFKVPEKRLPL